MKPFLLDREVELIRKRTLNGAKYLTAELPEWEKKVDPLEDRRPIVVQLVGGTNKFAAFKRLDISPGRAVSLGLLYDKKRFKDHPDGTMAIVVAEMEYCWRAVWRCLVAQIPIEFPVQQYELSF